MEEKILGKIDFAEFGTFKDYPFLIGLILGFRLADKTEVLTGSQMCVNISPDCKWENENERREHVTLIVEKVAEILKDAKVNSVSELIGKPVEVTIDRNMFKSFRILTEVL